MDESLATYKKAFSADETSIEALAGVIHCQIICGEIEEAEQQLEFLAEVYTHAPSLSLPPLSPPLQPSITPVFLRLLYYNT